MHEKSKKIDCLFEKFSEALELVLSQGLFSKEVQTEEVGALTDMVKDMAEAKKDLWKACYYETIVEAMKEESMGEEHRYGYDNWRYSSGRFAPKGRGHLSGYMPYLKMDEPEREMYERMGYDHDTMITKDRSKYGKAFEDYQNLRRHYAETGSEEDKKRMEDKADEHVYDALESFKMIYKNGDPAMKKRLKEDLMAALKDMP